MALTVGNMVRPKSSFQWMIALAVAFSLRIALAPFTGHPYDLSIWMYTGQYVGTSWRSPYELNPSIGYPPLWALWCAVSFLTSNALAPSSRFLYIFILKVPIIAADFLIAYLLIRKSTLVPPATHSIAEMFLLNPYVLAVGVIWGMMDNLVALLIILCALYLITGKAWYAGTCLAFSVSLKLYPAILIPICLAYLLRDGRGQKLERITQALYFADAFGLSILVSIVLPLLTFGWNKTGLLDVLFSQVGRQPAGGIGPMAALNYLVGVGVSKVGPIDIGGLLLAQPLRLLWISAILFVLLFVVVNKPLRSLSALLREFGLTYSAYLLVAPWTSEQLLEPLLVLMLFIGVSKGFKKRDLLYYLLGSAIVFVFLAIHVPATSFLFPIAGIEPQQTTSWTALILTLLVIVFSAWLVVFAARDAKQLERTFVSP